ncbi:Lethal(3)malignant brain tumor-like protein 1 [Halotydeus destructor]|nr:Lethal(3)malignant brain tumor-like protein 1 [Halotydeus destructor]
MEPKKKAEENKIVTRTAAAAAAAASLATENNSVNDNNERSTPVKSNSDSKPGTKDTAGTKSATTTPSQSPVSLTITNGEIRPVTRSAQITRSIAPKPVNIKFPPTTMTIKQEAAPTTIEIKSTNATVKKTTTLPLIATSSAGETAKILMAGDAGTQVAVVPGSVPGTIKMAIVPSSDGHLMAIPMNALKRMPSKSHVITIPVQQSNISTTAGTTLLTAGANTLLKGKSSEVNNPGTQLKKVATCTATILLNTTKVVNAQFSQSGALTTSCGSTLVSLTPIVPASSVPDTKTVSLPIAVSGTITLASIQQTPPPPPLFTMSTVAPIKTDTISLANSTVFAPLPSLTPGSVVSETVSAEQKTIVINAPAAIKGTTVESIREDVSRALSLPGAKTFRLAGPKDGVSSKISLDDVKPFQDIKEEINAPESIIDIDVDPKTVVSWKDGVGTLPGSNLKFTVERGGLKTVIEQEAGESKIAASATNSERIEVLKQIKQDLAARSSRSSSQEDPPSYSTCFNCKKKGPTGTYIRQGRYCSQECATIQSTHLRLYTNRRRTSVVQINGNGTISPLTTSDTDKFPNRQKLSEVHSNGPPSPSSDSAKNVKRKVVRANGAASPTASIDSKKGSVKRKAQVNGGPASPSNTSDSTKFSRPSSPVSSVQQPNDDDVVVPNKVSRPASPVTSTPENALHQSIFAMRNSQHLEENVPSNWNENCKPLMPMIRSVNAKDVLKWDSEKVAGFINSIPGCKDIGQTFCDELVDGEAFLLLNQTDIVKVLNVKLGPAVKIFNSILVLREALVD